MLFKGCVQLYAVVCSCVQLYAVVCSCVQLYAVVCSCMQLCAVFSMTRLYRDIRGSVNYPLKMPRIMAVEKV